MAKEIERKYQISESEWMNVVKPEPVQIVQAYLVDQSDFVIRIRKEGNRGYLTIKGKNKGMVRDEFEYEIPIDDAFGLMHLVPGQQLKTITKKRYTFDDNWTFGLTNFIVDVFEEDNTGLIVAEFELESVDEKIIFPEWIDPKKEVTMYPSFYNNNLIKKPFNTW